MVDKDSPDFYVLFLNGNQGSPNLSFASIDWNRDCPNFKKSEIDRNWDYQWVHLGLIPYVKLGKCVCFKKAELFRWIDKNFRKERISFRSVEKVLGKYPAPRQKEFFELE